MDNMPDRIWITMEDHAASWAGSFRRWHASDLEHEGDEYPRYIRADVVAGLLSEACSIIRKGQAAASASYHQAYAEWRGHDKTETVHEAVVRDFRNEARRFLTVHEETA